jgi:hypothetical protein
MISTTIAVLISLLALREATKARATATKALLLAEKAVDLAASPLTTLVYQNVGRPELPEPAPPPVALPAFLDMDQHRN